MAGVWSVLQIKDAVGTTIPMLAWDSSGTGAGPWSYGHMLANPDATPGNFVSGCISSAMTGTSSTSLLAPPVAGLRNYITQITVSNSHATIGTDVLIQDGSGGTTLMVIPAAAAYGGAAITFPVPLRQPTAATAIYVANVTTGASIKISCSGYIGQ
jgi:hypothetical protein